MKGRPIIFSGEMVRAILDGRKTQTRRVVLPQPIKNPGGKYEPSDPVEGMDGKWHFMSGVVSYAHNDVRCPYGQPGDRLWVRETFALVQYRRADFVSSLKRAGGDGSLCSYRDYSVEYAADPPKDPRPSWHPSIHMPRWASRITLEVAGVRVERLDDMGETDAIFEGVEALVDETQEDPWAQTDYLAAYRQLWDSLNAKRDYGWDVNPWVWVIEFKRVEERVIDLMAALKTSLAAVPIESVRREP